ncbi:sensor histidine kinase [Pseudonocardia hispaniensis]|uniref:histidine kinase n=1 Tax=Pseudonocardia hispaniensis TaxID=904933 RepID=A0ABW1J8W4_9PSEU
MDPVTALARPPTRPRWVEYVMAAALLVWAVLEALVSGGEWPVEVLVAAIWSLPVVLLRIAPGPGLAVVLAVFLGHALSGPELLPGAMPLPSILLLVFGAGLWMASAVWSVSSVVAAAATVLGVQAFGYYAADGAGQYLVGVFFIVGAWTAGRMIRRRAVQLRRAHEAAARSAQEAVAAERRRIAHELHDVVAHAVSVIAVQAGAAEDLMESHPERARVHLGHVRHGAREAMTEMRRLLEVLDPDTLQVGPSASRGGTAVERDPLPGTDRIDELVDQTRAAGIEVEVCQEGAFRPLPAALDLAVYRVVQEALTNVRRHCAGGRAVVVLRTSIDAVEIEVRSTGGNGPVARTGGGAVAVAAGGRGLAGMAERVRVFDGEVEAGPRGDGFVVHARLPVGTEADA